MTAFKSLPKALKKKLKGTGIKARSAKRKIKLKSLAKQAKKIFEKGKSDLERTTKKALKKNPKKKVVRKKTK